VNTDEFRLLLSLEPAWTVSVNGSEFLAQRTEEIDVQGEMLRVGKLTRKILDLRWLRPDVVRVQARSRMRRVTDTLIFYPGGTLPPDAATRKRRRTFQSELATALARQFRSGRAARQTLHSDKQHGIGGAYPRFALGPRRVIAVSPDESSAVVNGIMRAAIQWSALVRRKVTVVVPAGRQRTLAARLKVMPELRLCLDWLQWNSDELSELDLDAPEPETRVHPYYEPGVQGEAARLCALAPELLQAALHLPSRAVSIRLRGLEIARVSEAGTAYPMGEPLEPLIELLARERRHGSRHPLARAHEESWLESNLVRQIGQLLPVRPDCIYPQVPSFVGDDRRIIDLLAVTTAGRLAVIEVKAGADPELPFQALDYWLAVERHRKANDFKNSGYFPGVEIRDQPALLVMVAPLLAFHRTFDRLVSFFPAGLPMLQVGINQNWKKEIRILRRKGSLS
jgi:hypothetical protein